MVTGPELVDTRTAACGRDVATESTALSGVTPAPRLTLYRKRNHA
jgi:hypothetical protein